MSLTSGDTWTIGRLLVFVDEQSQQQLFNDFVLLREKYDEAKSRMGDILWSYLPANTNYCPSVPPTNPALLESDKRWVERY